MMVAMPYPCRDLEQQKKRKKWLHKLLVPWIGVFSVQQTRGITCWSPLQLRVTPHSDSERRNVLAACPRHRTTVEQMTTRRHGPSNILEELASRIVPQPGPQWMSGKELSPAAPQGLEKLDGIWGCFLTTLAVESEHLAMMVEHAEAYENMKLTDREVHGEYTAEQEAAAAVHRSVWYNLGIAREFIRSLENSHSADNSSISVDMLLNDLDAGASICEDSTGLASAIERAWEAACDPEMLWAAQLLLGECRKLSLSQL